MMSIKTFL